MTASHARSQLRHRPNLLITRSVPYSTASDKAGVSASVNEV